MPKGEVGKIVARLVKSFQACGDGKVTPPPDYAAPCTTAKNLGYRGRPIRTCVIPTQATNWQSLYNLVLEGSYFRREGKIWIHVNMDQCARPQRWAQEMRSTLRHELTHAADPYVTHRKTPYAHPDTVSRCHYWLDPVEVTARIAQVEEELLRSETRRTIRRDVRHGMLRPGGLHHVLHESPTYVKGLPCISEAPKVRRRFYQLAARLWASGKLGPRPT